MAPEDPQYLDPPGTDRNRNWFKLETTYIFEINQSLPSGLRPHLLHESDTGAEYHQTI